MKRETPTLYKIAKTSESKNVENEPMFFTMAFKTKNRAMYNDVEYPVFKRDCPNACAKIEYQNGRPKFFIKFGPYGEMLNFKDTMTTPNPSKVENGILQWRYVGVNQNCFNHYISFLKTGNTARLQLARRAL